MEIELRDLEQEIKTRKTEALKIMNLQEKVDEQRNIKELEKHRNELRHNLYKAQDDVDARKEMLNESIEKRMNQNIELNELFTIRWSLIKKKLRKFLTPCVKNKL